jgi:hypothetical protein
VKVDDRIWRLGWLLLRRLQAGIQVDTSFYRETQRLGSIVAIELSSFDVAIEPRIRPPVAIHNLKRDVGSELNPIKNRNCPYDVSNNKGE